MKTISKIYKWILKNKKWVFSGIGVAILSLLFNMLFNSKDNMVDTYEHQEEINNVEIDGDINGNIYQNSPVYNFIVNQEKDRIIEKDGTSQFSKIIDLENNKHWSEKYIIGIPYEPDLDVQKWIKNAVDYTDDWDAYEARLLYSGEDTAVEKAALVGKTENFLIYDICKNNGSILVKTSEDFYVLAEGIPSTTMNGAKWQPSFMEADYDNDGNNELTIRVRLLTGTGECIDSLFMVDKVSNEQWYMFQFILTDYLEIIYEKCSQVIKDGSSYFIWNGNVIDIPIKLEDKWGSNSYCIGEIVSIKYYSEQIFIKLDVGFDLGAYWDYSSGHCIWAEVRYQGEGKWELVNPVYYNDLLEEYIT